MKVARSPGELGARPRAVALGTFDGVHRGHRRVLDAAVAAGEAPPVVPFDPHPRVARGYGHELLTSLDRRRALLAGAGIDEALVVEFDLELAQLGPEEFVERVLLAIGADVVVAGTNVRFGRGRSGDSCASGSQATGHRSRSTGCRSGSSSASTCGPRRCTSRRCSTA